MPTDLSDATPVNAYASFPIFITGTEEVAYVAVHDAPAGSSEQERLDPGTLAEIHAMVRAGAADLEHASTLGRRLFAALFAPRLRRLYDASRGKVSASGDRLRLMLHVDVDGLRDWPWELLVDPQDGEFLALKPEISIARYLPREEPGAVPSRQGPLRVLAVFASPQAPHLPALDLQRELDLIAEALASAERPQLTMDVLIDTAYPVRPDRYLQRLGLPTVEELNARARDYDVLHFAGHGGFGPEDEGVLKENHDGIHMNLRRLLYKRKPTAGGTRRVEGISPTLQLRSAALLDLFGAGGESGEEGIDVLTDLGRRAEAGVGRHLLAHPGPDVLVGVEVGAVGR
jgi:hypothetical protein